jgi:DNA-binding PadR family transcriptional regulator
MTNPPETAWVPKARIRVTEEGAAYLRRILEDHLAAQREIRRLMPSEGKRSLNRGIRVTRHIIEEVERTCTEMGWTTSP